jgi:hypothetical protein
MFITALMPLHEDSTTCKASEVDSPADEINKYLYVAVPGLRDYLEFGGHGLLVFDIEDDYRFVKRIPVAGRRIRSDYGRERLAGQPSNVKGITASLATNSIYISNLETMQRIDLNTEQVVWEYQYGGGADRMAISSDGKIIYLPSLERDHWNVVDAESGRVIKSLYTGNHGAHNTVFGLDGKKVYLGGLRTNSLGVVDAKNHEVIRQIGPLGGEVRPFTINGRRRRISLDRKRLRFDDGTAEGSLKCWCRPVRLSPAPRMLSCWVTRRVARENPQRRFTSPLRY